MSETETTDAVPAGHYRCEHCEGVFEKGWSDEEAAAEAARNFPDMADDDRAVICDDCYREFMAWLDKGGARG